MTDGRRVNVSPVAAAAAVLVILLVGAGGTYLLMRDRAPQPGAGTPTATGGGPRPPSSATTPAPPGPSTAALPDVVVTLTKDAVDRAGISVEPVATTAATESLRVPGVVEPNAYRQVSVTPLVSGRIVSVPAQLGDRVRRGQPVAQVYSPEIAEARTKYTAAKAMLDAHDRELQRTQKLVEIGAASRQELERIHAEHAAQTAEVESARSRLRLLGASTDRPAGNAEESATTNVPAPIDGTVTERLANVGLNVEPTTRLFTIVDLSNVWIIADVHERDLHRVRAGARATVSANAIPGRSFEGRVGYIDPQLNAASRTAKVRIELDNPRAELRLAMYADVSIESAHAAPMLVVPKDAIQHVGDRQVVYLSRPGEPATFVEREVRPGRVVDERIEVVGGLSPGDAVVSKGSFFVRAEAERLGLRNAAQSAPAGAPAADARTGQAVQTAKIASTERGYEPDRITVRAGGPVRLTFVRTTDKTCGTEVIFPSLKIRRPLPLNEPVVIEFTPAKAGEITFACGMNMLTGAVVVQ
jgi:RND family efflux transporter MFP subunit